MTKGFRRRARRAVLLRKNVRRNVHLLSALLLFGSFAWGQTERVQKHGGAHGRDGNDPTCSESPSPGKAPCFNDAGKIEDSALPVASGMMQWTIPDPAIDAQSEELHGLPKLAAGKISHLVCACEGTVCSVSLNLDARAVSALSTPGTDLHTSEIVADEDGVTMTSFGGDDTNAFNEVWNLSISAVENAPTMLRCWVTVDKQ